MGQGVSQWLVPRERARILQRWIKETLHCKQCDINPRKVDARL